MPGQDLIEQGLRDLARREPTVAAFLVSIGPPRLRQLGYLIPDPLAKPELGLYALLAEEDPNAAHGRCNALVRRLVSFERAAASTERGDAQQRVRNMRNRKRLTSRHHQ